MNKKEINKILKGVIWDYDIDPYDLYLITLEQKPPVGFFTKENILRRFLERLTWYEIQTLYTKEYLKKNITTLLVNRMRNKHIKQKYELIRKVLREEPISFSGWDSENRKRIKSTLLSNRWYGA
jgi:hypothetical protein